MTHVNPFLTAPDEDDTVTEVSVLDASGIVDAGAAEVVGSSGEPAPLDLKLEYSESHNLVYNSNITIRTLVPDSKNRTNRILYSTRTSFS